MSRPRSLCLLVALAALIVAAPASARTVVLAPLGGLGIPTSEAGKVQRWIEAALAGIPHHRWLSAGRLAKLLRQQKHVGCESQPSCLGGLARVVGAEHVVAGEVGSLGGGYMIYLRLIDAAGKVVRSESAVLDPNQGLRDAARALTYRLLLPERYSGTIKLKVDVANAWIYIDGRRVASSPSQPLRSIPVGTHALRVTHEAYRDFVRFVTVGFDEEVEVEVRLSAFPVKAGEMRLVDPGQDKPLADHELPWYRRWWAVTTFGVVLLAATTTTVALIARRSVSRDSEITVHP
jgi:hypothetical protein